MQCFVRISEEKVNFYRQGIARYEHQSRQLSMSRTPATTAATIAKD